MIGIYRNFLQQKNTGLNLPFSSMLFLSDVLYLSVIFPKKRTKAHFAMFQAKWPSPVCPLLSPNATKRRFKASTFVVYVLFIIFFIIAELLDMARWDLGNWCPSNVKNRIYQKNSKLSEQTIIVINCPSFTLFLSFFFVCSKLYKFNSLLTSFRDIWSSSAMRGCVYRLG